MSQKKRSSSTYINDNPIRNIMKILKEEIVRFNATHPRHMWKYAKAKLLRKRARIILENLRSKSQEQS